MPVLSDLMNSPEYVNFERKKEVQCEIIFLEIKTNHSDALKMFIFKLSKSDKRLNNEEREDGLPKHYNELVLKHDTSNYSGFRQHSTGSNKGASVEADGEPPVPVAPKISTGVKKQVQFQDSASELKPGGIVSFEAKPGAIMSSLASKKQDSGSKSLLQGESQQRESSSKNGPQQTPHGTSQPASRSRDSSKAGQTSESS